MAYRDHLITSMEQLQAIYGEKLPTSVIKEIDYVNDGYRKLIEAAPFLAVATVRARRPAIVRQKAMLRVLCIFSTTRHSRYPIGPGNNRIDGFRNIMRDPRIALLFLIPGVGETLRVNGRASISIDPELMQSFAVNGKLPRCILIIHIETIYFHCAKAIVRSKLWDEATKIDRKSLPSTGTIVAELSEGKLGGEKYDREAPERIKAQLY